MTQPSSVFHNGRTPEESLLLACARTRVEPATAKRILRLLQGSIDWEALLQLAAEHDVVPLLYRNLESLAPEALPQTIRPELKRQLQAGTQGNLSLTRELLALVRLFLEHRIDVLPYKGPMLAAAVYHDLALRPFGDLDILVHERDVRQVVDVLLASGYEIIRPRNVVQAEPELRPLWIQYLISRSPWAYQLVLWHPERQGIVELHWRVTPSYVFSAPPDVLWKDPGTVNLGGMSIPSLSPENLLWFLCLHGTRHQWKHLRWVCDVAELVREYPGLRWEQVIARASQLGVERRLFLGLLLANQILDAPLPPLIQARIDSLPEVNDLARSVMDRFFESQKAPSGWEGIRVLRFQLRAMDRRGDRARYFLRFFRGLDSAVTAEHRFVKRFSLLALFAHFQGFLQRLRPAGTHPRRRLAKTD